MKILNKSENLCFPTDLSFSYLAGIGRQYKFEFSIWLKIQVNCFSHLSAEASKTDNTTRIAIGVGVAAGLAIIALVVILVIRARRQKTRKYEQEEAKKDLEMFTNFTTVRDRIRQDSTPNPLIEALARLTPSQKPPHCRLDKVEYVKDLGQGQFGKVFQGRSFKAAVRQEP